MAAVMATVKNDNDGKGWIIFLDDPLYYVEVSLAIVRISSERSTKGGKRTSIKGRLIVQKELLRVCS